jgi:hypothetical protein
LRQCEQLRTQLLRLWVDSSGSGIILFVFIISYRAFSFLVGEQGEEFFFGFGRMDCTDGGRECVELGWCSFGIWKLRASLPWSRIRVKSGSAPPFCVRLGALKLLSFWVFYVTEVIFSKALLMNDTLPTHAGVGHQRTEVPALVTTGRRYPTPYELLGGGIIWEGLLPQKVIGIFWARPKTSARPA